MNIHVRRTSTWSLVWATCLLICLVAGCGPRQETASAVDANTAKKTLEDVLTSWKNGDSPDAWQQRSPKVVVQDLDWAGGAKLMNYEGLGPGESRDANLYCKVKLNVERTSQPVREMVVTYVVGTDPVLTVFRDALQ